MKLVNWRLFILLLSFRTLTINAQPQGGRWGIGINGMLGFLMPHNDFIRSIQAEHAKGIEIQLRRRLMGERVWHHKHRYPTYGVSLLWFDGGNLTQIGYARGISPFAEFVVFKTKKIEANFHLATGIASLTKPFDLVENQKNVAIGSSISGVMQGILNIQYFFHPNLSAHVGLCITHFSNSNIQLPNYGLNYPHIRFGINTFFHEKKPIPQQIRPNPQPSKHRLQVHVAIATKQMEEIENKRFFPRMLSIKYARTIGQTGLFTGAVELFNDPSQLVRRYQKDTVSNLFSSFDIAFVPGYEILFGRLSIVMNIGVYAFRKNPVYTVTYQRLGIRYEPFDRVYCLVALKTHFAQSDFIEWGIGINLYKKKSKKAD